jgi:hypothetical protein
MKCCATSLGLMSLVTVSLHAQFAMQGPEPPVPSDPLELAGNAQPVQDATQRAAVPNMLATARRVSNVRAQPYDLKTTFTVAGSSTSDGTWQMEDVSPSASLYRWTVQSPAYSAVHLSAERMQYSSLSPDAIPLRLLQVRAAIFYASAEVGPYASLRVANGNFNGVDVTCALIARGALFRAPVAPAPALSAGGRRWEEEEVCVDPKAGTMMTHSLVPGSYVAYDYSKGITFHGKLIPNKFTITQGGQMVAEAETQSVTDPANEPAAFQPAGLNALGAGPIMSGPWNLRSSRSFPSGTRANGNQFVVLHGVRSPDDKVSDLEVLASSDASLNDQALAQTAQSSGLLLAQENEPGATPQSHEVLVTVEYFSPGQQAAVSQQ